MNNINQDTKKTTSNILKRATNIITVLPIFTILGVELFIKFIQSSPYENSYSTDSKIEGLKVFQIAILGIWLAIILFRYLQTGFPFNVDVFKIIKHSLTRSLFNEANFSDLKHEPEPQNSISGNPAPLYPYSHKFIDKYNSKIAKQERKISQLRYENYLLQSEERQSQSCKRLNDEISKLGFRNNVNLVVGVLSTTFGIWLLWTLVSNQNTSIGSNSDYVRAFIPRLTLAIFVEIFAYFFLKLYKNGLGEIKYFQNELTNIESKELALEFAIKTNNPEIIKKVIVKIANTERNHILEKGQTTIELEIAKRDSGEVRKSVREISAIFQGISRKTLPEVNNKGADA